MTNPDPSVIADLTPTGVLRASINLGNPVLAQGTAETPAGVTVDIAREVAGRLGVPVRYECFDAARKSFEALTTGQADICFLAIEPKRAAEIAFTAPYTLIEGVYAVREDSPLTSAAQADADGIRIGVKEGSAYDLFLTRTLKHASIVRGGDGTDLFAEEGLDVAAGVREPVTAYIASHPGLRLLEGRFMEIRQAVGVARGKRPETAAFLHGVVEDLKANGFIADALRHSGQTAPVAPPA
ncbi:MAG TPA: transporter substrate-binding domain-containing protein [Trebonia sp.]|jgi:polar amino acid transport system substrate-binding protein